MRGEQTEGGRSTTYIASGSRELALDYLKTVEARRNRKGDDNARVNRWLAAFGDQDINSITIRQIEKVLTELQAVWDAVRVEVSSHAEPLCSPLPCSFMEGG